MKRAFVLLAFILLANIANLKAQDDDLLAIVEEEPSLTQFAKASFKTTRVINGHAMENVARGVLDVKISHRFGFLNSGAYELFGLDQATIRIGADYGISDRLMAGFGRSSFEKTYDAFGKYKILRQSSGEKNMPFSLLWFGSVAVTTIKFQDGETETDFLSRLSYTNQLIIGRKFSESLTLQLMPTLVHRNVVKHAGEANDVFALGIAGRQKLSKRLALNVEYYYLLPDQVDERFANSLSIGFDIETGGHVFQLHFTNSTSMIERGFITETVGKWDEGDVHFGFNISRVFTIKDNRK